ncbi:hypothetical protein B447_18578 [Thauera sp. 27]|nr:hypothetical protein B447_18578 [Thauera sp. 27]
MALAVSALSFIAAAWAAWVSHRMLAQERDVRKDERRITFERERSELLEVINTSRMLLEQTRLRIGALKSRFDAAPQPVRTLLGNYAGLFTEFLPRVEVGVRQCNALWDEVAAWDQDKGIYALVHHQARYRKLVNDDQLAHDSGVLLLAACEEKMAKATAHVSHAAR